MWVDGGLPPAPDTVVESIAFPVHLEDVYAVGQAIQQGTGEAFAAEHLGPLVEGQVGRDHDAAAFIAFGKELKEQFRPSLGKGDIAELVDNDQQCRDLGGGGGRLPVTGIQRKEGENTRLLYLLPKLKR